MSRATCYRGALVAFLALGLFEVLAPNAAAQLNRVSVNQIVGILGVGKGGSGAATFTAHGVLLGEGTAAYGVTGVCGTGTLLYGQAGADPVCSTTTWPNAATQGDLLTATGANAVGVVSAVAVGQVLASNGANAVPAYTASPSVTTLTLGSPASGVGAIRLANAASINFRNAANNADVVGFGVNSSNQQVVGTGLVVSGSNSFSNWALSNVFATNTVPVIGTCGTSPSVAASNGTITFNLNVGTGGVATSCAATLPAAPTGWNCSVFDITTQSTTVFLQKQTASSTTSVTFTNYNTAGAAAAFVASDILHAICLGY